MIVGIVFVQEGTRRIPIVSARRQVGRKLYREKTSYLPLRLNQGGVMPIIFASAVLVLPLSLTQYISNQGFVQFVSTYLNPTSLLYVAIYLVLIVFFSYFYASLVVNPEDMSKNLKKMGASIPGIRPGKATSDYIGRVLNRLTFLGAIFLGLVAVIPSAVESATRVRTFQGLGATSLLILVGGRYRHGEASTDLCNLSTLRRNGETIVTRLIFLGPPGAGKGTQAKKLCHMCNVPHISTGDILRSSVSRQTELGKKAEQYMKAGELVPDSLIYDLIRERLGADDVGLGWVLDGFPRNLEQADFLDGLLADIAQPFECAVNLEVPDEVIIARLVQRGVEQGRSDDNEETIRHRLEVYRDSTAPLIDFYRGRQQLVSVNGNQPMDLVTDALLKVVQI